jgi:hypothetical protein
VDWEFHQATGMVAAQLDIASMDAAAQHLAWAAEVFGESLHDAAVLVVERRVRLTLCQGGVRVRARD